MGGDERKARESQFFDGEDAIGGNRNHSGIICGHEHNVAGNNLGVGDIERICAPLLHIILEAPVALKPDSSFIADKALPKDLRDFSHHLGFAKIGAGQEQREDGTGHNSPEAEGRYSDLDIA